jgi:hypothetical protein
MAIRNIPCESAMHKAEKKKPQDDVNPKMGLRKLKPKQSKMNIYNTKKERY